MQFCLESSSEPIKEEIFFEISLSEIQLKQFFSSENDKEKPILEKWWKLTQNWDLLQIKIIIIKKKRFIYINCIMNIITHTPYTSNHIVIVIIKKYSAIPNDYCYIVPHLFGNLHKVESHHETLE